MYCMKSFIFVIIVSIDHVETNSQMIPFNTIVAFGDSNTDTGNVYNLTNHQWPLVPPYYLGRFTNGPVWIERINIPNIKNYAYDDATIDNDNLITGFTGPKKIPVPGIRQQIVTYLANNDISIVDLSHTLYIIWASGNEYRINSSVSVDMVIDSLLSSAYDLLVLGIQHLIIVNLPPLQFFPGMDTDPRFETLTTEHNKLLLSNISQIQLDYMKSSVQIFDIYSLITTIIMNKSMKLDKCWTTFNNSIIFQCKNPNEYIFIDDYHFTSVIHQIIADHIQQFISSFSLRTSSTSKVSIFICIFVSVIKKY